MSETPVALPPMSKELETPDGKVRSGKQFAEMAYELQEGEVQQALNICVSIINKYSKRIASEANLSALEDEVKTRMYEIGVLATFDPTPILYGKEPTIDILGKVSSDPIHVEGFDHERKQYEVQKATKRGEDYLGQKEAPNTRRAKK